MMRNPRLRRGGLRTAALVLAATVVLLAGGCPIDVDQLLTDVLNAVLQSASTSLVDSFSDSLSDPLP